MPKTPSFLAHSIKILIISPSFPLSIREMRLCKWFQSSAFNDDRNLSVTKAPFNNCLGGRINVVSDRVSWFYTYTNCRQLIVTREIKRPTCVIYRAHCRQSIGPEWVRKLWFYLGSSAYAVHLTKFFGPKPRCLSRWLEIVICSLISGSSVDGNLSIMETSSLLTDKAYFGLGKITNSQHPHACRMYGGTDFSATVNPRQIGHARLIDGWFMRDNNIMKASGRLLLWLMTYSVHCWKN